MEYTYTIDIPDFVLPADGSSTVNCPADAAVPAPLQLRMRCGNVITPVAGPAPSPTACEGAMIYTVHLHDCVWQQSRMELHVHDRHT
jgi:hypothetical protein